MKIMLDNQSSTLEVDLFGGAITAFRLNDKDGINPLSFAFTKDQMPANNKSGAAYQGHFLCLGRWGPPSEGEIKAGIPNHGEAANLLWTRKESSHNRLNMGVEAYKEGLSVERTIALDQKSPVFAVKETVTNIHALGRLFNMVQHPTIAAPFLDESTIIDSNASIGFDQSSYTHVHENCFRWPGVKDRAGNLLDLGKCRDEYAYNAVFSFLSSTENEYGWISAYSPAFRLLFGYVWKRSDFPWIHFWQHWEGNKIKYRGLEFGTAALHQPFRETIETATTLFGQKTFGYIDAGETVSKNYFSFIYSLDEPISGVEDISVTNTAIQIKIKEGQTIDINISPDLIHELYK